MERLLAHKTDFRQWNENGEAYDAFATEEPTGEWSYQLDDPNVIYGPGPWPFWLSQPQVVQLEYRVQRKLHRLVDLVPNGPSASGRTHHATILLGPRDDAFVTLEVFMAAEDTGGIVQRLDARITLPELVWHWTKAPPERIARAAQVKRDKVIEFLRRSMSERDRGMRAPGSAPDVSDTAENLARGCSRI